MSARPAKRDMAQHYRLLASNIPDGDLYLLDRDLRFVVADGSEMKRLGLSSRYFEGKTLYEVLDPAMRELLLPAYRAALIGESRETEAEYGGHTYLVRTAPVAGEKGQIDYGIAISQNITHRKRAEIELRKSEKLYHDLVEASQDLIWRTDLRGRFTYLNPSWERTHGYPVARMLGRAISDFQNPEVAARDLIEFTRQISKGSVRAYETTHLARDGRVIHLVVNALPLRDDSGAIVGAQGTAFDITDRKAAQAQVQALYEQAQLDSEAKARLLAEVNHRVKNNLMSILGLLLAERRLSPEQGRPWVEASVERISRRIRGLLAAHQSLSDNEWSALLVTDLAQQMIQGALSADPDPSRIAVAITASSARISPRQVSSLALVLNELATNTLKYGLSEGRCRIGFEVRLQGDGLCLEYRDDGPGYPSYLKKGVGLNLVRELIEGTLRGTLELVNEGGAVARIWIKMEEPDRT